MKFTSLPINRCPVLGDGSTRVFFFVLITCTKLWPCLTIVVSICRDLRPTSLDKSQETWRLRMYELYAWGIPIIIAVTAAIFDNLPEGAFPSVLKPKFAVNNCWFPGKLTENADASNSNEWIRARTTQHAGNGAGRPPFAAIPNR